MSGLRFIFRGAIKGDGVNSRRSDPLGLVVGFNFQISSNYTETRCLITYSFVCTVVVKKNDVIVTIYSPGS